MNKKSPVEMERAKVIEVTRAVLRLKHRLAYLDDVNEILPDRLEEFDKGIQRGELLGPDTKLLEDIV